MAGLEPDSATDVSRWPLLLGAAVGVGLFFYFLEPILLPFVVGALIGYLGDPLVDYLEQHHINRTVSVVLVFTMFTALLVLAAVFAIPLLAQQLDSLIHKVPDIYRWATETAIPWLQQRVGVYTGDMPKIDWSGQIADNWQSLSRLTAQTVKKITGSGAGLLLGLANLTLVPVVAF